MFEEELSSNASKKRQEAAKARRQQLKERRIRQQQASQKNKFNKTTTSTSASFLTSLPKSNVSSSTSSAVSLPNSSNVLLLPGSRELSNQQPLLKQQQKSQESSSKNSAVSVALQQRQARQELQKRTKSAIRIQAFWRAVRSNHLLLNQQGKLLSSRFQDLETLRKIVKERTQREYTAPPATVTALARQLIFLVKTNRVQKQQQQRIIIRSHQDIVRTRCFVQMLLLPGLKTTNNNYVGADHLDPLSPWLESFAGICRLKELLRLVLIVMMDKRVDQQTLTILDSFLRISLGLTSQSTAKLVEECRHFLLPILPARYNPQQQEETASNNNSQNNNNTKKLQHAKKYPPCVFVGSNLDLICMLRHHLLFFAGDPIPAMALKQREACYTDAQKHSNNVLFCLVLDAILVAQKERVVWRHEDRFVTEIFTIPLLTWKLSSPSISKLLLPTIYDGSNGPTMIYLLKRLVDYHGATLSAGKMDTLLPTIYLSSACPATNTQCLLANLVQVCRICPALNGSDKTNHSDAAFLFNFIATLLDVIPLSTLSSARESAVEWISTGGKSHQLAAIVLSPVILEQCKVILLDSFVRNLFRQATSGSFDFADILKQKTEKDKRMEKDLSATATAASLAAKEARVNRSKGFWNTSKWAKKVSKGVSHILSGGDGGKQQHQNQQQRPLELANQSLVSRRLAQGARLRNTEINNISKKHFDPTLFFALCRAYGIVLARWGGGGNQEIFRKQQLDSLGDVHHHRDVPVERKSIATLKPDPCAVALLNVLCFSTRLVSITWAQIQSTPAISRSLDTLCEEGNNNEWIQNLTCRPQWRQDNQQQQQQAVESSSQGPTQLFVFLSCLAHILIITDDVELHDMDRPLPLHQIRRCILLLKKLLLCACTIGGGVDDNKDVISPTTSFARRKKLSSSSSSSCLGYLGPALVSAAAKTMRDLYDRSSRRPFCAPKLWIVDDLLEKDIRRCKTFADYERLLTTTPVLHVCPFLVSFKRRLKLFERIVTTNRIGIQGQNSSNPFSMDPGLKPGIPIRVMRGRVLEDGLATMNHLGKNMRQRIVVHYTNEAGTEESGIDVGGLFKEFWTDLSAVAFNVNYALFKVSEGGDNCLYPNPSSAAAHGVDHITLFEFLGRILGKALYESITIHPQFAHFFLSFLRGEYNFFHMLPDLSTLDPQLYNNLMFLKTYDGDAADLCLVFTVASDDLGGSKEIALIPNGADIPVTNENKQRYIELVAKFHVYDCLKEQSEAFTRGLWDVIDKSWLYIFNEPELQVLISGPTDGKIDVEDMKRNTRYAGGFTGLERSITRFWNVMGSLTSQQQALLLRFVTSCERPPPLGFACMNPPFTIQRVVILRDGDKLPSASTCFNTLKLPTYSSEKVMKQRLIYAIESGAGFEMS